MTKLDQINKEIRDITSELKSVKSTLLRSQKRLESKLEKLMTVKVKHCKHTHLIDVPGKGYRDIFDKWNWKHAIRVCADCGLAENSLGCNYTVLKEAKNGSVKIIEEGGSPKITAWVNNR